MPNARPENNSLPARPAKAGTCRGTLRVPAIDPGLAMRTGKLLYPIPLDR